MFVITLATSKGGEQKSKVVASISLSLKMQLEQYVKARPGEAEQASVIKGLKLLGFVLLTPHGLSIRELLGSY